MASFQNRGGPSLPATATRSLKRLHRQNLQNQRTYSLHSRGTLQHIAEKVKLYLGRFYLNRKVPNEDYWY